VDHLPREVQARALPRGQHPKPESGFLQSRADRHVIGKSAELDNGSEIASCRTRFMKRLVEFVDHHRIAIRLTYLPPDHSKYNPIERCWGILEQHWNGMLLHSVEHAFRWAGSRTARMRGRSVCLRTMVPIVLNSARLE